MTTLFNIKPKISTRIVCQAAMLIALTFVLERFLPVVSLPTLRITLAFIPIMFCGMLFGPVWGAVSWGVADIIGWPLMGLVPIPLVLFSRVTEGFIYGFLLHRENAKFFPHAVISALSIQLICGAGLTTLGLSHFFGQPYFPLLATRVIQFVIYFALQLAVFPGLVRLQSAVQKSGLVANR